MSEAKTKGKQLQTKAPARWVMNSRVLFITQRWGHGKTIGKQLKKRRETHHSVAPPLPLPNLLLICVVHLLLICGGSAPHYFHYSEGWFINQAGFPAVWRPKVYLVLAPPNNFLYSEGVY